MTHANSLRANRRMQAYAVVALLVLAAAALAFLHARPAAAQLPITFTLSVPDASVAETAGSVTVTASLSHRTLTGGLEVTLKPMSGDPGTASLGRDYTLPDTFTIPAGETTATADVIIMDDAVNERDETINLTASLSNEFGVAITGVTITIQDNEKTRMPPGSGSYSGLQPENVRAAPRNEGLTITFDRAVLSGVTFWLQWRAEDNPEWTTVTPVSSGYTIGNLENGVLHYVRVTGDTGAHRGGWVSASGTPGIRLKLSAPNTSVAETAGSVTVTATLDQPAPAGGVEVTLEPRSGDPGTAAPGRDYTLPETFTVAAGDTSAEADVIIIDDAVNERDETINLTAAVSNAFNATITGVTITIRDNEESRDPPGSGSYSGLQPENVRAVPRNEGLTITFDRAVLTVTFWLQWRAEDNPEWTTVTPVTSPHTIGNLENGVLHYVRVTGDTGAHRGGWVSASGTPGPGGL